MQMEGDLALVVPPPVDDCHLLQNNVYFDHLQQMQKHKKSDNGGNENQKKKDNNGGNDGKKKNEEELPSVTVVMKVDFHCGGCRSRIFNAARNFRGAETVKVEEDKNKLTVIGKVDPAKLHQKLEKSTKKKIELVSPQLKKNDKNQQQKNDLNNNNKPKEPPLTTVVFKISLHCDGCCNRIRHIIKKTRGVHTVEIEREKDKVTVRGTVDPKEVQLRLKKKMKRVAEIVPVKKDKGGGEEKEKWDEFNGGGNQKQLLQQQMQKSQKNCNNNNGHVSNGKENGKMMDELMEYYGPIYGHIPSCGYVVERLHAPQFFSDDNPNACSIM